MPADFLSSVMLAINPPKLPAAQVRAAKLNSMRSGIIPTDPRVAANPVGKAALDTLQIGRDTVRYVDDQKKLMQMGSPAGFAQAALDFNRPTPVSTFFDRVRAANGMTATQTYFGVPQPQARAQQPAGNPMLNSMVSNTLMARYKAKMGVL